MLKALIRWLWPSDASGTQEKRTRHYVSHDELEDALKRFAERQEFEFNEWYEKFSALHARLTKRVQRASHSEGAADAASPGRTESASGEPARLSVLHYRKPWSV